MALLYTPHLASVYRAVTPNSNDYVSNGNAVYGLLQPVDSAVAYQSWGIDTDQPSEWFCNIGEDIDVGDRLLVDGSYWEVKALPKKYTSIFYLAYAKYLVQRVGEDQ